MFVFDLAEIWLPGAEAWLAPEPEPEPESDATAGEPAPAPAAEPDR